MRCHDSFDQVLGIFECTMSICISLKVNSDLGGIDVYISLYTQLAIVLAASFAILLATWKPLKDYPCVSKHLDITITALNNFHKQQCCFLSAVLVACILWYFGENHDERIPIFPIYRPLTLNGCVPIVYSQILIAGVGQTTWHMICLSFLPVALSVVSAFYGLVGTGGGGGSSYSDQNLRSLCGSLRDRINTDKYGSTPTETSLIFLVNVYCTLCLFAVIVWKLRKTVLSNKTALEDRHLLRRFNRWLDDIHMYRRIKLMRAVVLTFLPLFAYQIYLYIKVQRDHFVSQDCTFGQIIAITIWAPSIAEFFFLGSLGIERASESRFPPGYHVVKSMARDTVVLANLDVETPQGSVHKENTC